MQLTCAGQMALAGAEASTTAPVRRHLFQMIMLIFSRNKTGAKATWKAQATAVVALWMLVGVTNAQELNSSWEMHISDLQHAFKTEATVQFTDENVTSCMRGKWKRLTVNAKDGTDTTFFPLTEPMAYKVEHGVLTLARTKVCNPYVLLTGISGPQDIHGTYKAVSVGRSKNRGFFSLRDITAPPGGNSAPRSAGLMASVVPARAGN